MTDWETSLLKKCKYTPDIYSRYLDDRFGVWEHGEEEFDHFIKSENTHHSNITVKYKKM